MSDRYPNRLAQALGDELIRRGWSHRRAGMAMGLNHVTVSALVMGTTPNPTWETLAKAASLLAVDDATARRWLREPPVAGAPAVTSTGEPSSGMMAAAAAVRPGSTVLLYSPDGEVEGLDQLDARERRALERVLATIREWRAAGRGEVGVGGGESGPEGPD